MPDAAAKGFRFGIALTLALRYEHGVGELTPYFDGLRNRVLQATRCASCGSVWAPPRLVCSCGSALVQWSALSGFGRVVSVTRTPSSLPATQTRGPMGFALVRFDGATNASLVRFEPADALVAGQRVTLAPVDGEAGGHPVQSLIVVAVPPLA